MKINRKHIFNRNTDACGIATAMDINKKSMGAKTESMNTNRKSLVFNRSIDVSKIYICFAIAMNTARKSIETNTTSMGTCRNSLVSNKSADAFIEDQ